MHLAFPSFRSLSLLLLLLLPASSALLGTVKRKPVHLRRCPLVMCSPENARAAPTILALGPLFAAQVSGEQYFVPVYLPLLMFVVASVGRISGPPAASALAGATLLYSVCSGPLTHVASPDASLISLNLAACVLLLAEDFLSSANGSLSPRPRAAQPQTSAEIYARLVEKAEQNTSADETLRPRVDGGDSSDGLLREEDRSIAFVLTLLLALFLTTTANPIADLRT